MGLTIDTGDGTMNAYVLELQRRATVKRSPNIFE